MTFKWRVKTLIGSISSKSDRSASTADKKFADFSYIDNHVFNEDGLNANDLASLSKQASTSTEER